MSAGLAWVLVGLGLSVLAVRRRSLAVSAVTAQSLVLAGLAILTGGGGGDRVAAAALAGRSLGLAAFFLFLVTRTREPRPVSTSMAPLRRSGLGVAFALALIWLLLPAVGGDSRGGPAVLALVAFGLVVVATRRETLFQVLGVVGVENGLVLAAVQLPQTSWLIEVGVAVDLMLIALVAGVFHHRIFAEFGAGDSDVLRSLRD